MEAKARFVVLLGLVIAATPYLGIPSAWKTPLYTGTGLLIALLALLIRHQSGRSRRADSFVENGTHTSKQNGSEHENVSEQ
jgi:hypothetical protein